MVGNERLVLVKKMSVEISSGYKWNYLERTKNNEPVIISYKENDLQGSQLYLTKTCGANSGRFQAEISTSKMERSHLLSLLQRAKEEEPDLDTMICVCGITCEGEDRQKGYVKNCFLF